MGKYRDEIEYLKPRHAATDIVMHSNVAFFVACHDRDAAEYHWQTVHRQFAKLADDLGYRIEKIETETRACQITGLSYEAQIEAPFSDEQLGLKP